MRVPCASGERVISNRGYVAIDSLDLASNSMNDDSEYSEFAIDDD